MQGYSPINVPVKCLICNSLILRENGNQKICSPECYEKHVRNKNLKRIYSDRYKNSVKYFWQESLWKNSTYKIMKCTSDGYKLAYFNKSNVTIPEHRLVMMLALGRKLEKWEHVHHIDGNKSNNDIKNLKLLNSTDHFEYTVLMKENKVLRAKIKELEELILLKDAESIVK